MQVIRVKISVCLIRPLPFVLVGFFFFSVHIAFWDCFSTLCRQVFKTEDNMVAVFNITTGYVSITFVGSEDVDLGIVSLFAHHLLFL